MKNTLAISNVIRITLDFREIFLGLGGTALAVSMIRPILDLPPELLAITGFCSVVLVIKGVRFIGRPNRQKAPDDSGFSRSEYGNDRERKWNDIIRRALNLRVPKNIDWKNDLHLTLVDVDCSNIKLPTSFVILKFRIENYLDVPMFLDIVTQSGGSIGGQWLDAVLNLPTLSHYINVSVGERGPKEINIRLDINSPKLQSTLIDAAEKQRSVQWLFWGDWYAEAYGSRQRVWDTSTILSCNSVPRIGE